MEETHFDDLANVSYEEQIERQREIIRLYEVERRKQEEKIHNLEKELNDVQESKKNLAEFTAALVELAHELKTPLNSIIGIASILPTDIEHLEENSSIILSGGTILTDLINSVMELSKLESKAIDLDIKEINIRETFTTIIESLSGNAKDAKVIFKFEINNESETVQTDWRSLRYIIMNLVGNAVKFTPENGTVTLSINEITAEDNQNYLQIKVSDTGMGIPDEAQQLIFEPYKQVKRSIGSKEDFVKNVGTGLGLATVKKYVALLGGIVDLESKVGEGTTFTVTLPTRNQLDA